MRCLRCRWFQNPHEDSVIPESTWGFWGFRNPHEDLGIPKILMRIQESQNPREDSGIIDASDASIYQMLWHIRGSRSDLATSVIMIIQQFTSIPWTYVCDNCIERSKSPSNPLNPRSGGHVTQKSRSYEDNPPKRGQASFWRSSLVLEVTWFWK